MNTGNNNLMVANHQWMSRPADERFQTMADLGASVHARRLRSRSIDIDRNDVLATATDDGNIIVNSRLTPCVPSHWAFGQLCQASRLNGVAAPSAYIRQLPAPLAVQCLNQGFKYGDREAHKFMTIEPANEPGGIHGSGEASGLATLQAVTSTTYGRIWDADVVEAVNRIVERSGGKFFNPPDWSKKPSGLYASDHDVFIFMIDGGSIVDGGPRAQLNRGFITWNSETGARTFGLMTFLFNQVCGNHIIWGARDISQLLIRHSSGGPSRFDLEAMPTLKAYTEASAAPLEATVRKAQSYLLPDAQPGEFEKAMLDWAAKHGKFTRSEVAGAIQFAKAEEGECRNLWQFVQGATAYARGFDYIDTRVDVEKRFGKLLDLADATKN